MPGHVASGSKRRAVCARRHSSLASSSSRAHRCAPAPTTNAVSVLCMTKKFCATNTWDDKHSKSTINHPNQNSQAMASLCEWRCFKKKLTSNGVALQATNETQPVNADSNKGFAASLRHIGLGSCGKTRQNARCQPRPRPLHRLVIRERTTTKTRNNKCALR